MIYVDGSALEQFLPRAVHFEAWTAWAVPRINDLVTTQVGMTELRHTAELLPRDARQQAFDMIEQVKQRLRVERMSEDWMPVSGFAASVLKPFAALQLGAAVGMEGVDAIATYDADLARAAELYRLAVVTPGMPRGWHNGETAA